MNAQRTPAPEIWLAIGWGEGSADMRVVRNDAEMVQWLWETCGPSDHNSEAQDRASWAEYVADEDNWTHLQQDVRRWRCTFEVGETGHIELIRLLDDVARLHDSLLEACDAAMQCIGELPPTQARVEVAQLLQAAIAAAKGQPG